MWPTYDHKASCNDCLCCIILEFYYHLLDISMYDSSGKFNFSLTHRRRKKRDEHLRQKHPLPVPGPGHTLTFSPLKSLLIRRWGGVTAVNGMFLHSEAWYHIHTIKIRFDCNFQKKNPTNLIWLLLAGDLWVSKTEGLFCFLFTGSEKEDQRKWSHNGTLL